MNNKDNNDELDKFIKSALPWAAFLPEDDYTLFKNELYETLSECSKNENYSDLKIMMAAWHGTAEIWKDPELAESLLLSIDEPIGRDIL